MTIAVMLPAVSVSMTAVSVRAAMPMSAAVSGMTSAVSVAQAEMPSSENGHAGDSSESDVQAKPINVHRHRLLARAKLSLARRAIWRALLRLYLNNPLSTNRICREIAIKVLWAHMTFLNIPILAISYALS